MGISGLKSGSNYPCLSGIESATRATVIAVNTLGPPPMKRKRDDNHTT